MSNAKKDRSEIFRTMALHLGTKKATIYDNSFQLSPNGLTFKTDASLPAWTEVDMKLELPANKNATRKSTGRHKQPSTQKIGCRGIVVQSEKQSKSGVYDVALLFCGVTPRVQQKLRDAAKQLSTIS